MYRKIIATDLDGTFLRSDHQFDKKRLRAVLHRFAEKQYLFVPASGRSLLSLEEVFKEFKDEVAFVAENGSIVSYKGELIFEDEPIAQETYLSIVEGLKQSPYKNHEFVVLSGRNGAYLLEETPQEYFEFISQYYIQTKKVADFSEIQEDIVKIVATFDVEVVKEAQEWLNATFPGVTAVTTGFSSVDIILSGINKSIGLSKLCERFNVPASEVVAFGDNQNDLEMLEFAGWSVATENAQPEVKAVANQIIGECDTESVMAYMEELE